MTTTSPQPLQIVFLITELEVGGAERCLANLACGLDRTRFRTRVCSLGPRPSAGKDQLVRQLEEARVPAHFLDVRSTWQAPLAVRRLHRYLSAERVDLLQTFLFHANVLGASAARRAGISHTVAGVRVADPSRWRMWLERRMVKGLDRVVCVSQSVADFVRTRGGFPAHKLLVIPNGIDISPYSASAHAHDVASPKVQPPVLLCVGRLDRQKGFDWLLDMAAEILRQLPTHELHIVGDGPERASLLRRAETTSVSDRIRFLGWRDDVPQLLAASHLLLLPSRWEGMPNVLLEAMAAGLPVVAAQVEGMHEVVGETAEQQLVPWGDSQRFVAAVVQLATNANLAADLGKRNRARVASRFSLAAMISQYEKLYTELLSS